MFNRGKCYHFCAKHLMGDGNVEYSDGLLEFRISPFQEGFYRSIRSAIAAGMNNPCSPDDLIVLSLTRIR